MGLFKTKKTSKGSNMISEGTILVPDTLTSTEEQVTVPASSNSSSGTESAEVPRKRVPRARGPSVTKPKATTVAAESPQPTTIPSKNINFAENFKNWTVSPILNQIYRSDIKIPTIELKEYILLDSTLWEQAKYFMYIAKTVPGRAAEDVETFAGGGEGNFLSKTLEATQDIVDSTFSGVGTVLDGLGFATPDLANQSGSDPYEGLYKLTKTGFNYTFPFYSNDMRNKASSFAEGYSGDGKGELSPANIAEEKIKLVATQLSGNIRSLIEPGIYIEKTRYYNYGSSLESVSFSFPLLNTISQEQINENYQFLFLLIYQNSIFRKDRAAFIPPCIYEVLIPGHRYMKYAYISNLKIDYIGTRRMIEVDSGIGNFKTIVPEAYNVSLTLNNLHEENGNFMIRSAANSISQVIISDI